MWRIKFCFCLLALTECFYSEFVVFFLFIFIIILMLCHWLSFFPSITELMPVNCIYVPFSAIFIHFLRLFEWALLRPFLFVYFRTTFLNLFLFCSVFGEGFIRFFYPRMSLWLVIFRPQKFLLFFHTFFFVVCSSWDENLAPYGGSDRNLWWRIESHFSIIKYDSWIW